MSDHSDESGHDDSDEIVVFIVRRETNCDACQRELGKGAWIRLDKVGDARRALCLDCAHLNHLDFLAGGNAAVTRRATKYSSMRAIVVRWARARKRYERQGILAEPHAVERAEEECLPPAELRERRRIRELHRRMDELDSNTVEPHQE